MHQKHAGTSRLAVVTVTAGATLLLSVAQAHAHAIISPAVAKTTAMQQFTLSVPTEKDKLTTTKIVLDVAPGFAIDSYEAEPGWTRSTVQSGSGKSAVDSKVTWTGGHVPTGEDAVFRFNATAPSSKKYMFKVTQTYSDGSVVEWSDPSESTDHPAPRIETMSSFGGGGSSNTLGVIALIVAVLALVLGGIGLAGGRRSLT
jgi:uncharacterized protein YcnI